MSFLNHRRLILKNTETEHFASLFLWLPGLFLLLLGGVFRVSQERRKQLASLPVPSASWAVPRVPEREKQRPWVVSGYPGALFPFHPHQPTSRRGVGA
jgi:hypothetical protein